MDSTPTPLTRTPLQEASDPATNAERLRELARYRGEVGRAVASNPNTPTYLLVWLAKRYCTEVLHNPVLPLLLLEDPGLPLKLPVKALREILRDWEPPGEFLHPLKRHPDAEIREAARLHVANKELAMEENLTPTLELKGGDSLAELVEMGGAPEWLLGAALECDSTKIRARALVVVCKGQNQSLRDRVKLLRAAGGGGWLSSVGKAEKNLALESLATLAIGGPYARKLAAHNPATPPEALEALGRSHESPVVRRMIARNPGTPISTLLSFALSGDDVLRCAVAANRSLPTSTLDQLSADAKAEVRESVAGNPATSATTLLRLATDPRANVRTRLAKNRNADQTTLEHLLKDSDANVRRALAERSGCPAVILKKLLKDSDDFVSMRAVHNRALPGDREQNLDRYYRRRSDGVERAEIDQPPTAAEVDALLCEKEARDTATTPEALAKLASHPADAVRRYVALHASTSPEILGSLAHDADGQVRAMVAHNKVTPLEILLLLMEDSDVSVRSSLASNASLPAELTEKLAADENEDVRSRVPFNQSASPELLIRMATEETSEKVHGSLRNGSGTNTPDEALIILAKRCETCRKGLEHYSGQTPAVMEAVIEKIEPYARHMFLFSNEYHHRSQNPYQKPNHPIPPHLLLKLAHVPDDKYLIWTHKTMAEVAEYWAVTPEVLESMALELLNESIMSYHRINGRIVIALTAIARNKKTPTHILQRLLEHQVPKIRLAALGNPSTPSEAKVARLTPTLEMAASSAALGTRLCALSHPQTAHATLRQAAWHGRWAERYAITQNPAAPRDVLAALTEDSNRAVSHAARKAFRARFPDAFLNQTT